MFNSSRSLLLSFNLLVLFTALALAAPLRAPLNIPSAVPNSFTGLGKRYSNARFTYYDAGQNACGSWDSNKDFIIALSPKLFNNGAHCYKTVTVQYNGKQVQAKVTDECPGCNGAEADLSRPLFEQLAPLDRGVLYGEWWFN